MAVFGGVPSGFYLKSRPKRYKASDAAYPTGGNKGMVLARYPKEYPLTDQQKKVRDAARACGIKPGMDKADLQEAMKECIPDQF
jgi:hypothetical protein